MPFELLGRAESVELGAATGRSSRTGKAEEDKGRRIEVNVVVSFQGKKVISGQPFILLPPSTKYVSALRGALARDRAPNYLGVPDELPQYFVRKGSGGWEEVEDANPARGQATPSKFTGQEVTGWSVHSPSHIHSANFSNSTASFPDCEARPPIDSSTNLRSPQTSELEDSVSGQAVKPIDISCSFHQQKTP